MVLTKAPWHLTNVTVPATNSRETGKELALFWGISPALLPAPASLGALSGGSRQDTNLKEGRVTWSTELPRSEVPIERS